MEGYHRITAAKMMLGVRAPLYAGPGMSMYGQNRWVQDWREMQDLITIQEVYFTETRNYKRYINLRYCRCRGVA